MIFSNWVIFFYLTVQPRLLQGPPQILQNVGQLRPAAGVPGQQQIGVLNGHGILSRLPNGQVNFQMIIKNFIE